MSVISHGMSLSVLYYAYGWTILWDREGDSKSPQTGSWSSTNLKIAYNVWDTILNHPVKFQTIPTYGFWEKLDEKFGIFWRVLSKQSSVKQEVDVRRP